MYEPSEIVDKMMTEEDETIRIRDIPERFQVYSKIRLELKITYLLLLFRFWTIQSKQQIKSFAVNLNISQIKC